MSRVYKQSAIYDAASQACAISGNLPVNIWASPLKSRIIWQPSLSRKPVRTGSRNRPSLPFRFLSGTVCGGTFTHPVPASNWPIKDGDVPDLGKAQTEWRVGNWILTGSSTSPIEVFINQGGVLVPLKARMDVKPGDHVSVTTSIAVKVNDPRGIKCYINKVAFMGPGDEIVIGNSASAAELMAAAKAPGLERDRLWRGWCTAAGFWLCPADSRPCSWADGTGPCELCFPA